jgi:precorrin-4/cobalt-precorrin-4 C11-methyltransferase
MSLSGLRHGPVEPGHDVVSAVSVHRPIRISACGVEPQPHRDTGQTHAIRPGIHAQTPPTFDQAHVMTVHFIGSGPGAADLITVRGRDLIAASPVCLYAGSLVPPDMLAWCPPGARIVDTAPLSLDRIVAEFVRAAAEHQDVARLHSGDLSVWSALAEQLRRLDALGLPYTITPGVPSFAASAAALARELTLPGVCQSVVLTRTGGRASAMPERETLEAFAATGATMAIHLSIHVLDSVVARLTPFYGPDCPAAVVYRASWPDQRVIRGTLATIVALTGEAKLERTALILVGPVVGAPEFRDSALYDADYQRRFRSLGRDA